MTSHRQTFVRLYKPRKFNYCGLCPKPATAMEDAFPWLVENLSREGDTVVDVDSKSGGAFVAALKGNRHAVWISSASFEMQSEMKATVDSTFASDSDDRTISAD